MTEQTGDATDEATVSQGFRAIVEEMIAAWDTAPALDPVHLPNADRADFAAAGAAAIAWAWTNRVTRTAQAVLLLHDNEFDAEGAPLIRSMLEHGVAIYWITDKRGEAYQVLVRDRSDKMELFQKAQAKGWELSEESQALLQEAIDIGTDPETKRGDRLIKSAHRAAESGLGSIHQAWIVG